MFGGKYFERKWPKFAGNNKGNIHLSSNRIQSGSTRTVTQSVTSLPMTTLPKSRAELSCLLIVAAYCSLHIQSINSQVQPQWLTGVFFSQDIYVAYRCLIKKKL